METTVCQLASQSAPCACSYAANEWNSVIFSSISTVPDLCVRGTSFESCPGTGFCGGGFACVLSPGILLASIVKQAMSAYSTGIVILLSHFDTRVVGTT